MVLSLLYRSFAKETYHFVVVLIQPTMLCCAYYVVLFTQCCVNNVSVQFVRELCVSVCVCVCVCACVHVCVCVYVSVPQALDFSMTES